MILAKLWCGAPQPPSPSSTNYGFPAFDINDEVVGFYREVYLDNDINDVDCAIPIFLPISDCHSLGVDQRKEIVDRLELETKNKSESIQRIDNDVEDSERLPKLIERSMNYTWNKILADKNNERSSDSYRSNSSLKGKGGFWLELMELS